MRLFVMFDLPMNTAAERKEYSKFRRFLVKEGFIMMQQSVYSKLMINENAIQFELDRLEKFKPKYGLVQALRVTEKQFSTMVYIAGEEIERAEVQSRDELLVL